MRREAKNEEQEVVHDLSVLEAVGAEAMSDKPSSVLRMENALGVAFDAKMMDSFYRRALRLKDAHIATLADDLNSIEAVNPFQLKEDFKVIEPYILKELVDELARVGVVSAVNIRDADQPAEIRVSLGEAGLLLRSLAAYQLATRSEEDAPKDAIGEVLGKYVAIQPYGEGIPYNADKENRDDARRIADQFGLRYTGQDSQGQTAPETAVAPEKNVGEQIVDALLKAGIIKP